MIPWSSEVRPTRFRLTVRRMIVAAIILATSSMLAIVCRSLYQHREHLAWYHRIEERIVRLAKKRPQEVSPNQWAYDIHWTWNLHCNCGTPDQFDGNERERFLAEFDRRLEGRVDLGTIDWIWDEFSEHSRCGGWYSRNFRPTDPAHLRAWFTGQEAGYDLQYWIDRKN
jgi:hypothetical protein